MKRVTTMEFETDEIQQKGCAYCCISVNIQSRLAVRHIFCHSLPSHHNCPLSEMTTSFLGTSFAPTGFFSMASSTGKPSTTLPKTQCAPLRWGVSTKQRKNYEPFVPGPALAMDKIPLPVCLSFQFSSANSFP